MAELPFLVVHGALVWKASTLAVGGLAVKTASWMRDRRSSKFVRRATKHYTSTATGLEPGPILVRGHLRGGGAQSFEYGKLDVVHARDAGAYVDIEGERIDFDGDVVVGCGTETRTSFWRPPVGAPDVATRRGPQRLSLVRANDEVLVAGVLSRATTGDIDYRDSAAGWRLSPFPRQDAVGLVARDHRARAMPVGPIRNTLRFAIFGLLMLAGMRTCGAIEEGARGPGAIHSATIAAAMPGTRDEALVALDRLYLDERTPDGIDHAIALRKMQRSCASAVDLMFDESRLEQALETARSCDLREREIDALVLLGRYDEAAALPTLHTDGTPDENELVAIAGNHFDEAAKYTDACAAALLEAMGAKATAVPPALLDGSVRCALLGTQLLPHAARRVAADAITTDGDADTRLAFALVDLDTTSTPREDGDLERSALDLIRADAHPTSTSVWTSHPGDITPARAVFETYRGDFDAAQAIAGALIKQSDHEHLLPAERFAALIAMRAGRPVPTEWLEHDSDFHTGSVFTDPELGAAFVIARGNVPSLARGAYGIGIAIDGDGGRLHADARDLSLDDGVKLIAVLPRITSSREQALDFVRGLRGAPMDAADGPFRIIRAAAMRRDLARATGDADDVARWQGIIDRHMAVVADRDRLLALLTR